MGVALWGRASVRQTSYCLVLFQLRYPQHVPVLHGKHSAGQLSWHAGYFMHCYLLALHRIFVHTKIVHVCVLGLASISATAAK
jgi:hypothetical protein